MDRAARQDPTGCVDQMDRAARQDPTGCVDQKDRAARQDPTGCVDQMDRASQWCWLPVIPHLYAAEPEPTRESSTITLPKHVSKPELPQTGWERIRELFERDEMQPRSEEVSSVIKSSVTAAVVGLLYGGLPAARQARQSFIQQSQADIFNSRLHAVRSAHNAAIRGFVRYGWRWSWRVAAFVTLFNSVSLGISVYRDEYAVSHYAAAGAITGGLFRLNLGLAGSVVGSSIGALLGVPAGALIMAMQKLSGETIRERKRRERRELYELKLEEWNARLQMTDDLIQQMRSSEQNDNSDLHKIDDLLNQPRNKNQIPNTDSQSQQC